MRRAASRPVPLRRRVALAFVALGFVLSLAFAIAVVAVTEDYEHVLAAEILRGQAEDYSLRLANGLPAELPRTHRLSGYLGRDVPATYAAYPPGVSEGPEDDGVHVGVFDTSAGHMTFVIDLRDIEELEEHLNLFLAAMVVLGTALAGWFGWMLAGTALAPVGRLAASVDALPTQPAATALRDATSGDELGRLAGAIDAYQARLVAADAHEQAFFADASHELRTPVAVVLGALEVLLDEPHPAALESRLRRVERGTGELSDLLEAMLDVARRRPPRLEDVDAAGFLRDAGGAALAQHPGVALEVRAGGTLRLAPREARLLLRGVLRRLLPHAAAGTLSLRLEDDALAIAFDAAGPATDPAAASSSTAPASAPASASAERSDTGNVPVLLDRLAQRLGWRIGFPAANRARIALQPPSQIMWTSARA
jgi:signal transduction histidine kinase